MDAKTRLCCLLGNPVGHSLSPFIHNTLGSKMGINMAYTAFQVEDANVGAAVHGAAAMGFAGLNVTVPHKMAVIPYLVETDPLAARIGAVNTLVPVAGGYKGYNTDMIGLQRQLQEEGILVKDRGVIILGAGGASRAIVYLCASLGAQKIWLLNRSIETANRLAKEVNSYFGDLVEPMGLEGYREIPPGKYPVIQTSSVGLFPHVDQTVIEDPLFYTLVEHGVDIIFNPFETAFMKHCKEAGAPAYNGLKMLLYQGVAAFELWFDVVVPKSYTDEILIAMEKELNPS